VTLPKAVSNETVHQTTVQLISETRQPLPAQPGQPARYDYEYRHAGTANLFLFVQPLRGWRHVNVTARRTKYDFALQKQGLVDVHFPEAEVIRLVVDNLNTHTPAALDETCAPAEARRLTRKLELHYTTTSPAAGVTATVASRVCRRHKRLGYSPAQCVAKGRVEARITPDCVE
jgi:hypothetical protein